MTRFPSAEALLLADLPSVLAHAARASLDMARFLSRWPRPLTLTLGDLGTVEIRPDRLDWGAQAAEGTVDLWGEIEGEPGCLSVDRSLAAQLVAVVCGRKPSSLAQHLKPCERGILAALVLSAFAGADEANRPVWRPRDGGAVLDQEARAVGFSISSSCGLVGRGSLRAPPSWFAGLRLSRSPRMRSSSAYFPLSVELARTCLSAGQIEAVQPGDGILFVGWHSGGAGSEWPVLLRMGGLGIRALLGADGAVRATTGIFQEKEVHAMKAEDEETQVDLPAVDEMLAAAPVTVVAELGRVVVRGDELAGLVPGAVLSLGPGAAGSIDLRIEGRQWAKGELVRIGDELAVRITQLIAG